MTRKSRAQSPKALPRSGGSWLRESGGDLRRADEPAADKPDAQPEKDKS